MSMSEAQTPAQTQPAPPEATQTLTEVPAPAAPGEATGLGGVWALYVLLAVVFLLLLYRWIRSLPKWLLVPLWSMFAAGALTPAPIEEGSVHSAPAAIVAILGAEQAGLPGFWRGGTPILVSFAGFCLILGGLFWWQARRQIAAAPDSVPAPEADTGADAEGPARTEPRL
jgi:hypothetical protein